jgi:hypothetical protein
MSTISALVITTLIAVFSHILSYKEHKGTSHNVLSWIVMVFLILSFGISVTGALKEKDEKEALLSLEGNRFDTTLMQLQTANQRLIRIVDSLRQVQDTIIMTNRMVGDQLQMQQEIGITTKKIQIKNENLLTSQIEIYKNTGRNLHPLFPLTLQVEFAIPFNSQGVKALAEYVTALKDSIEKNPKNTTTSLQLGDIIDSKVTRLRFGYNSKNKLDTIFDVGKFINPKLDISLIKGSFKDIQTHNHRIPQMHFEISDHLNREIDVIAFMPTETIHFIVTYKNYTYEGSGAGSNIFFGSDELLNCYLLGCIHTYWSDKVILKLIKFYPTHGHLEKCFVRFEEGDTIYHNNSQYYYHKIVKRNYKYWDEDED